MIKSEQISHHRQTLRLWEAMGREPVVTAIQGVDRRGRLRFQAYDRPCRLDVIGVETPTTVEVVVHDVCANGVCLLSPQALTSGVAVTLHPPPDDDSGVEAVDGRIVSCRKGRGKYRVGVRFSDAD